MVNVLQSAGHTVTGTDLGPVDWDRQPEGTAPYVVADLTDAGQVSLQVLHDLGLTQLATSNPGLLAVGAGLNFTSRGGRFTPRCATTTPCSPVGTCT